MLNQFSLCERLLHRSPEGASGSGGESKVNPSQQFQSDISNPEYLTKSNLESMLAKYINNQANNSISVNKDALTRIKEQKNQEEEEETTAKSLERAFVVKNDLTELATNLGGIYKELPKEYKNSGYSVIEVNKHIAKDIVSEFFSTKSNLEFVPQTLANKPQEFLTLNEKQKLEQALDFIDVIKLTKERIEQVKTGELKAKRNNNLSSSYEQKFMLRRNKLNYYNKPNPSQNQAGVI